MKARRPSRTLAGKVLDFLFFPIRAVLLFENDRWGLSSLRSERFELAARGVRGYTLDVGCGKDNAFVDGYLGGNGKGIDIYPYQGLSESNLVESLASFPAGPGEFATVTFIACLNHCPRAQRDAELAEAFRVLEPGGNVIVTMGQPVAEVLVHKLVEFYDRFLGTHVDVDSERGMESGEAYYLTDKEIRERLERAGFVHVKKDRLWTQWFLNSSFTATKPAML